MKLGIVMPVVLQNETMLSATVQAATSIRSAADMTLFVICNRLTVCSPEQLQDAIAANFFGKVKIDYEPYVERSVAGAWNEGCRQALSDGNDYIAMVANDTRMELDCIDRLVSYIAMGEADLASGISSNNRDRIDPSQVTDGADFSCFIIRPATLQRFGLFDPNFRPAYFEDNDYYARVVLGGGNCRVVHAAQFYHHGSLTVRTDGEMAHHVSYWFEKNRAYFSQKWGVATPENTAAGVRRKYFQHPFNDASRALSWFPEALS
jgi:GT2 family glycosyltransferase